MALEKAQTISAADHLLAAAKHINATARELPETPHDVMSMRRLESDMFAAKLKSASIWKGDAQLLETLLQGEAKLATLQT